MWHRHRTPILIAIGVAVLIALLVALTRLRPTQQQTSPPVPEPGRSRKGTVIVSASDGVLRSAGQRWVKARPGDELRAGDSVRTGAEQTVEIALGRGGTVAVTERSELALRELTGAVQRLGILRGRVTMDLRPDDLRILRAEDRSGAIFASGSGGRWHLVATPRGLGVAAENGAVRVESGGVAVDVPAGSESAAWRGATPLPPAPVPRDLTVRIAPSTEGKQASVCAVLQADVASEVLVNGEPAEVRADGAVTIRLPARARRHDHVADVVVRHATGKVERKTIQCGEAAPGVRATPRAR